MIFRRGALTLVNGTSRKSPQFHKALKSHIVMFTSTCVCCQMLLDETTCFTRFTFTSIKFLACLFFWLVAAWLNVSIVRAVALQSAVQGDIVALKMLDTAENQPRQQRKIEPTQTQCFFLARSCLGMSRADRPSVS